MKILRPGRLPTAKTINVLRGTCNRCNCLIEITEDEAVVIDKEGAVLCPTEKCGNGIVVSRFLIRSLS
jgi:hypothetical protein